MPEELSLFGEVAPYGPRIKSKDVFAKIRPDGTRYSRGFKGRLAAEGANKDGSALPSTSANHPGGPPPLDWWVIDD